MQKFRLGWYALNVLWEFVLDLERFTHHRQFSLSDSRSSESCHLVESSAWRTGLGILKLAQAQSANTGCLVGAAEGSWYRSCMDKWCGESAVFDYKLNVRRLKSETSNRAVETRSCTLGPFCLRADRDPAPLDSLEKGAFGMKSTFFCDLDQAQGCLRSRGGWRRRARLWLILNRRTVR